MSYTDCYMDIYTIIVAGHVIGTILGVGGATIAEFQITMALRDGKVIDDERALMHVNYTTIRVGMAVLLLSVIAMFWYHIGEGNDFIFTSEKIWIKELMLAAIFLNAVMLHKRLVPLWLGASISFTSWWGAALLGMAGRLPYSFETYFVAYLLAIGLVAGVSHWLRSRALKRGV